MNMKLRQLACVLFLCAALPAQNSPQTLSAPNPQTAAAPVQQASTQPGDELAQMRDDLNRLESLNLNMSSEIEFLRDQNLQILLRTNVQMWMVLIRDLRRQVEREEQRGTTPPPRGDRSSPAKPDR